MRFDPSRPVLATTRLWQRGEDGRWQRFLIREQANRSPIVSNLHQVQNDAPVCLVCLSTNVVLLESERYREGELQCNHCGARYGFLL